MNKKYIWIIIVISLFVFVFIIYSFDYCIAWHKNIDHNATLSFVSVLSLIITPTVTLISVILYFLSLKEQRKQNKLVMDQQFYDKWQSLLNAHLRIRDEQQITFEIIEKNKESKILLHGHFCFDALKERYLKLKEVIDVNENFSGFYQIIENKINYCEEMSQYWVTLEQCDYIKYKKEMENFDENIQIKYVGYLFNIKKDMNIENSSKKAFELVYDRYLSRSSIYLTHFCSLLKFLQRNENIYVDKITECIDSLMAILTESEKFIILLYADYDIENGKFIHKYIKS